MPHVTYGRNLSCCWCGCVTLPSPASLLQVPRVLLTLPLATPLGEVSCHDFHCETSIFACRFCTFLSLPHFGARGLLKFVNLFFFFSRPLLPKPRLVFVAIR